MEKNANKKHNVMKKKEMSILLKNMLKKEQQDKETLLKSIGISKDRITLGVEKACKREIKKCAQMRSSNNAFVAKQFTEQKDEIMEKINASYKLYKDTLDGNFKKIKNDIYKYYISNIDMYSENVISNYESCETRIPNIRTTCRSSSFIIKWQFKINKK